MGLGMGGDGYQSLGSHDCAIYILGPGGNLGDAEPLVVASILISVAPLVACQSAAGRVSRTGI